MLVVQYQTSRGTITKHYPASNFPCETIIKLVQTGVTVTINSAPSNAKLIDINVFSTQTALSLLTSDEVSIPDIIDPIPTSTFMLDLMEPADTSLDLSEGC